MDTNPTESYPTAEDLARCPRCGGFRKLIDVREEARKLGFSMPGNGPRYIIECCGIQISIEDDRVYKKIIEILLSQPKTT